MKISMELTIEKDNTDLIEKATTLAIYRALNAVGLQAEGYAKRLCPVDTGNLRNSITHGFDDTELVAYIGTNVEYAAYVEFGHTKPGGYVFEFENPVDYEMTQARMF